MIHRVLILIILLSSCNNQTKKLDNLLINGNPTLIKEKIFRVENGLQEAVLLTNKHDRTFSLQERMKYYEVPGLSIAVIKDNKIEWAKSYGLKLKNSTDSVSLSTKFQAASLSKPLTAIVALKMVDKKKIQLDSSVNSQLTTWKIPENDFTTDISITPRHLILHTSGLNVPAYPGYEKDSEIPELIELLNGVGNSNTEPTKVLVKPNTEWRYSGAGYSVLQLLMIEKSELSFPKLMQNELFKPLNITNSSFEQESLHDIAFAHLENGNVVEKGYHIYPEMAAAGLWTTPVDYAKVICELQKSYRGESNLILNQKSAQYALSKHWGGMGLGFILRNNGDSTALAYSGGNHGYICDIYSYLHNGSGVVIMTNSNNGAPLIEEIYRSLSKEYKWADWRPDTIHNITIDLVLINRIVGRYSGLSRDNEEFQFELINQTDGLYYKTREKIYPVFAISEFEFVIPEQNWRLSILNDNSEVDSLKFRLEYGKGIARRKN